VDQPLIGRARERDAIDAALASLRGGAAGLLVLEGEAGIGKSRLLGYVAGAEGCTVVEARASEYEADLPYALWTEALDRHLAEAGERRVARLGLADAAALAGVLPALGARGAGTADRHRTHRALRDLLERLAAARPLVVCLDDVHWADPASLDVLAALAHRLPAGPVLLAVAARAGQLPAPLAGGTRLRLGPLTEAEARELVGASVDAVYGDSGGNPFYLEQLARGRDSAERAGGAAVSPSAAGGGAVPSGAGDPSVPPAVAGALATELRGLTPGARRLLDAAAVIGDPFGPALAAETAELDEPAALAALDELLERELVRPGGAPRRFAFRHPVVRHAVYEAAPGGWRLGAHARAAAALERRGAGPVERAHHVEHAAGRGDAAAIALLGAAARELQSPAPATAARFYAAALRLLPDGAADRTAIEARLADAQAAAGDAAGALETLLGALRTAAPEGRLALTVAVANTEWWLGRTPDARRRLQVALGELPAQPSPDRIRLRLALALTALMSCDLRGACDQAADAAADARAIGEPVFEAAALAGGAVARVSDGDGPEPVEAAAAALERLRPEQLATRLPALWMLGRSRRWLGQFEPALAGLERGAALALATGRDNVRLQLVIERVATLIELGRLADATAAAEQGLELARLAGNPPLLLWAHCALAGARLAAGHVSAALQRADAAAATGIRPDFHAAGQPGWCRGAALTAAGNPERAVTAMLGSFGGPALPAVLPVERPAAAADLAEAQLAAGDVDAAVATLAPFIARGAEVAEGPLARASSWARAVVGVVHSAVLLARDRPGEAVAAARAAVAAADAAPFAHARARLAEGRALAAAGERGAALETLIAAEAALDGFGSLRRRDEAVRELRRLGHRVVRAAGDPREGPLAALTAREREIAVLVAAGRTNREVAEQLVLSARTIEAHLRNVYGKLGVRSRVELTRAVASRSRAGT
jgi:DNA-binding NarL/FixJ family response regulator